MKHVLSIFTLIMISISAAFAGPVLVPGLPATSGHLIFNSSWDKPIQWVDNDIGSPPTLCTSGVSETKAQCQFEALLPSYVPAEATAVLVRLKSVAQLMPASTTYDRSVFVLAYAWDPVTNTPSNHLIHTEVWGTTSNGQERLNRDIDYSMAWLPVFSGKVYLRAGHRILPLTMPEGNGYASIGATVEGYWLPDPTE